MLSEVGPQKLMEELKAQSPHYAKLLPQLPLLLHNYLSQRNTDSNVVVRELLQEQRRTNRLLQNLVYAATGFVLGMVAMQVVVRVAHFHW